eukprot:758894-Pyramimonas_sp.AAC.1
MKRLGDHGGPCAHAILGQPALPRGPRRGVQPSAACLGKERVHPLPLVVLDLRGAGVERVQDLGREGVRRPGVHHRRHQSTVDRQITRCRLRHAAADH